MIYVYSFDFDGCLANIDFLSRKKDFFTANKELLYFLKQNNNPGIVFIGSNRQGIPDDYNNSLDDARGSCYPAILVISQELKAFFDNLLLSDIYNDLPDGTTFNQALQYLAPNNKDYLPEKLQEIIASSNNWIHDTGKLTILYAQIHKVASEHPNEEIQFNFFDDKETILNGLHAYFLNILT